MEDADKRLGMSLSRATPNRPLPPIRRRLPCSRALRFRDFHSLKPFPRSLALKSRRPRAETCPAMPLTPLPIDDLIPGLIDALAEHRNAVVIAAPGAGKTTRVPPAIVAAPWMGSGAVSVLQPRRVAARATAQRIADEQRWRIGNEIGWHIRFDNRTGPSTRLKVMTEGILLRQIQADPFLEGTDVVVLDEFHERSVYTDVAVAMLREVQRTAREDLRIVVMSATLDPGPIARFLGDAPVLESAGRAFPVSISHRTRQPGTAVSDLAATVARDTLADRDSGHVLVFLPGIGEIRRVEDSLAGSLPPDVAVHVLHSSIPPEKQDAALAPTPLRKLILATNIAETSLTIDGVRTVVDSGLERVLVNDRDLGFDRLELRRISMASARQRAGRAGRTAPGRCIRLWGAGEEASMDPNATPELQRIDLSATLLGLHDFGVNPREFAWFEAPPTDAIAAGEQLLEMLGALDRHGRLTERGRRIASLPLHPRLAALVLAGVNAGLTETACAIAAVLSEKDIYTSAGPASARRPRWHSESDVLDRAEQLMESRQPPANADRAAWAAAQRLMGNLQELCRKQAPASRTADREDSAAALKLLLHAYPDRITVRREVDPTRGAMVGGRGVVLDGACTVREGRLFLSIDPREVTTYVGLECRVSLASRIEASWIREIHPNLVEQGVRCLYSEEKDRILMERTLAVRGLVYQADGISPSTNTDLAAETFQRALEERIPALVERNEELANLVGRLRLWLRVSGGNATPAHEVSTALATGAAAAGCLSIGDLMNRNPAALAFQNLDWKTQQALDRECPTHVTVPTGNRIKLDYTQGEQPVLAVRLQELFGQPESPTIASGRVRVLLHLLGPNRHPVQVTTDLRNFWNTTYAEVRKELRARYPKHAWPEDPWTEPPTARTKRRPPA